MRPKSSSSTFISRKAIARTVPSSIGTSYVLPVRLSVTVRVSLPSALKGGSPSSKWSSDLTGGRAVATLRRLDLALVVATQIGVAVWALRRAVERHERELRDRQAGVELDRHAGEVRDLERERPAEARIDEAGGRVDDQAQAPDRALALDARDDVVRQLDPLLRAPEDELARVDDERLPVVDLDAL